jgi:hypothetical protein
MLSTMVRVPSACVNRSFGSRKLVPPVIDLAMNL